MCLERVTPVIKVSDIEKAKDFYIGFLKFDVDWEYTVENGRYSYLQISKGNCILHLTEYCDDGFPGVNVRIETEDLSRYQQLLSENAPCPVNPEIVSMDWGTKDMVIVDPFGNRLTFTTGVC